MVILPPDAAGSASELGSVNAIAAWPSATTLAVADAAAALDVPIPVELYDESRTSLQASLAVEASRGARGAEYGPQAGPQANRRGHHLRR